MKQQQRMEQVEAEARGDVAGPAHQSAGEGGRACEAAAADGGGEDGEARRDVAGPSHQSAGGRRDAAEGTGRRTAAAQEQTTQWRPRWRPTRRRTSSSDATRRPWRAGREGGGRAGALQEVMAAQQARLRTAEAAHKGEKRERGSRWRAFGSHGAAAAATRHTHTAATKA